MKDITNTFDDFLLGFKRIYEYLGKDTFNRLMRGDCEQMKGQHGKTTDELFKQIRKKSPGGNDG